ncbi:MAG: HAD family hydrolase [Granulosicoccaceae bacterium]
MTLAIFDLDHTLLDGDGPELWFNFLISKGVVEESAHRKALSRFAELYNSGELDAQEWASYESAPQVTHSREQLLAWRDEFRDQHTRHRIPAESHELLANHRRQGHTRVVMSATNRFIVEASTALMDVDHVFATELREENGRCTGNIHGTPCFKEGKVAIIEEWAEKWGHDLDGAYFYSDSINDLPLLERVCNPVVVNADKRLAPIAKERGWPMLYHRV